MFEPEFSICVTELFYDGNTRCIGNCVGVIDRTVCWVHYEWIKDVNSLCVSDCVLLIQESAWVKSSGLSADWSDFNRKRSRLFDHDITIVDVADLIENIISTYMA